MTTSITHDPIFVADLDLLTPGLAVGGDLHPNLVQAAGQVRFLQSIGITDIIDCREEHSDEQLVAEVAPSIQYHYLPTDDHGGELHPRWWKQGVDIARDAADRGGRVFVHCHMGVNRGPSLALAILIDRGMDAVEAFRLLRARRPQAHAIYAPQYLTLLGKEIEAFALEQEMSATYDDDDLVATIGRIRQAEAEGYRFPLADDRPSIDVELEWGLRAFFHLMFAEGRRLQELGHHLIVRLVPWDDDDHQLRLELAERPAPLLETAVHRHPRPRPRGTAGSGAVGVAAIQPRHRGRLRRLVPQLGRSAVDRARDRRQRRGRIPRHRPEEARFRLGRGSRNPYRHHQDRSRLRIWLSHSTRPSRQQCGCR